MQPDVQRHCSLICNVTTYYTAQTETVSVRTWCTRVATTCPLPHQLA